jgi:hypothetical protein
MVIVIFSGMVIYEVPTIFNQACNHKDPTVREIGGRI